MLLEILLFLALGIVFGIITGLIPGIHINLVGVGLIALSASLLTFMHPIYFVVFITAMAITHTFVDFIPSIFLGCPDTDTELSILPGHDLLKKGQGYEAITLTAFGSLAAIFILILIAFPSVLILSKIYKFIKILIPGLLIFVSFFLISTERKMNKAFLVFVLAGLLGLAVLNLEKLNEPLLPLLTGLFGGSMLVISIRDKIQIPKQKITKTKPKLLKPLLGAVIASPLCSFLPGLGSGQAAIIGNSISKTDEKSDKRGFLVLLGATNTLVMGFSFIALYAIARTRTGATVAVKELLGNLTPQILILILFIILISGIVSFFLTLKLAKFFSKKIGNINYTLLSELTLIVLIIIVFLVSGWWGLLVLAASTATGVYCISLGVRRTNMMGCLLLPVIIFYLI
jgi:putative membrane protein